ncbi:KUP/HAK/KT family potassium transporter [Hymenobacter sp.]|jgi:KUP system potassium uptake protein|uniref:KUP/HAK/KT family potassium transporter n=1 Tax=Hymenobacter sp. TaxID=1898978 RepID=UPI002EDA1665
MASTNTTAAQAAPAPASAPAAPPAHGANLHVATPAGVLIALGIVYGDIGTSPLYTLRAIFARGPIQEEVVLGSVSAIFWTLTLLTTVKYMLLALRADNNGEGGILSLYALLRRRPTKWLYIPAILGASALLADGIITPPISVASAIEGLQILKPDLNTVPIILAIITGLFVFQQFGTAIIGKLFGPVMLVFFSMLAVLGVVQLLHYPAVFKALNPYYAINLVVNVPGGFWLLGAIFLCSTGAEALYADLGHVGRGNIYFSWTFVKVCLILNYFGQAAWLMQHVGQKLAGQNLFYKLMPDWFLLPGIAICTLATIIASQALISGSFTLIIEALRLRFWPKVRISYPTELRGQAYVPSINWLLYVGCVGVVLYFRESGNMEAAFGLAVTLTMLMTTVLLAYYLYYKRVSVLWIGLLVVVYFTIEGSFLVANLRKFPEGGWLSILLASIMLSVMLIWIRGQRLRNELTEFKDLAEYLPMLKELSNDHSVPKYATHLVYLTKSDNPKCVENGVIYSIFMKRPKRADVYYFIHVETTDDPYTTTYTVQHIMPNELVRIDFRLGFRVDHAINIMFRQVVTDLVKNKEVDITSRYESLNKNEIVGDFQFILLNKTLPTRYLLRGLLSTVMNLYERLKHLGVSEQESFGLDNSNVSIENVPLVIPARPELQLVREEVPAK